VIILIEFYTPKESRRWLYLWKTQLES